MHSDLEKQETHEGHLYDGYPDYRMGLDEEESTAEISISRQRTRITDPRSLATRIASHESRQPNFYHPLEHTPTTRNVIVDFDGPDDPYRPMNWPFYKKAYTTLIYGLVTMGATWGSSIYSSANEKISEKYHIGSVVATLGAPLSEVFGRRTAVFYPYFIGAIFAFDSATAKDTQTLMLTRFFGGFFSSAPVTNTGGVLGDLWTPAQRGPAMAAYAMAVASGPLAAPVVGGAIVDSYLSWRWVEYTTGILMMLILIIAIIFVDESYPPVLLVYKARRLRHEKGNWALHAKHEEWDVSFQQLATKYFVRPFQLLATPITACMAAYASFVYGILYLCFAAFPIEFEEERGWNHLVGSLPFLATLLGCITGASANSMNTKYYISRVAANRGRPVPEARLPPMMFGAIVFPAGCFLFGQTSSKHVFWLCPCIGAYLIGLGFITIFQCALNYLIDTFQVYAASAVAGNTALRSTFAGVFPLFAPAMFHNLGINWASSLIGFVSVALIPIPFIFFVYGKRVRAMGKCSRASCE
ncbi:MFS multidrug transporter [Mollisia scopiformis]|uniref:MFS multidrug transporter n=1 Tax=Mollisia scopiformis TaxID=149040 RepID=A0A194WZU3_MOLSC|nr:MFS multidrug transporter [Mollisia scopiformis]KUJ13463.1 MFS multidrug transporter [Mollisia scopiformis]